jgi:hypothetical protein
MVLAPAGLIDLGDVGAAFALAVKTGKDTADAAIAPAAPISTSRRDAFEFDEQEVVDMVYLKQNVVCGRIYCVIREMGC